MNMQRFVPYLGIVAALAFAMLVLTLAENMPVPEASVSRAPAATSTLSTLPGITLPPLALPNLEPAESTPAAASEERAEVAPKKAETPVAEQKSVMAQAPAVEPAPAPSPAPAAPAALDAAAAALRAALVNIMCYAPTGSSLRSTSGSGVFIDAKGIILTNAHVAQQFLLADRGVSCTIRSGSPAIDNYEASLVYISPPWIRANTDTLTTAAPIGTGEFDFALLAVTKSTPFRVLPETFPSVPLATAPSFSGTPVVIASYGAQFLVSSQVQSALFPTLVFGSVKEVFTFALNTIDVIALGGSAAAQEGSSGGGVADSSGELVGTITTSTIEGATDTRSLNAITASYIRAEYASETGSALDLLLAKPVATSITDFAPQASELTAILTAHLP